MLSRTNLPQNKHVLQIIPSRLQSSSLSNRSTTLWNGNDHHLITPNLFESPSLLSREDWPSIQSQTPCPLRSHVKPLATVKDNDAGEW